MSGVSPGGVAENGTRSGKESFDLLFMGWASRIYFPTSLRSRRVWFPPVNTTMKALTPQRSASAARLRSPCLSRLNFRTFRLQPPYCHFTRLSLTRYLFRSPCESSHRPPTWMPADLSRSSTGRLCGFRGSRDARTLPDRLGRIEFTCVTDCSFSSGCSPPSLTGTQLPIGYRAVTLP
jgi:hypothetical protein